MYTEGTKESNLKFYSLGIVAEDIVENSNIIKVYPHELLTNTVDVNVATVKTTTTNSTTSSGNEESIVVDKSSVIIAKWIPIGNNNRITAPMVCKGETVLLYNYAGTDQYYWSSIDNEMDLRKNEKATYFYSNKKTIDTSGNLVTKGYYFTVDCINKFLKLFTNKNDGEYTTYEFKINTKDGIVTLTDGKNNFIKLFSQEDKLVITTNKKVEVNTVDCIVNATESSTVNTKNSTINASDVSNVNTTTANIKASSQCNIQASQVTIKGKVNIN